MNINIDKNRLHIYIYIYILLRRIQIPDFGRVAFVDLPYENVFIHHETKQILHVNLL